jgi:dTDP-4-amino-4,6-dideoxygalactose transaminase
MISKTATNKNNFKRVFTKTNSARDAWSEIIEKYKISHSNGRILLPSYIGWSANEGSGIFDSVVNSGMEYNFYDLGLHLEINVDDLKLKTLKNDNPLVLLVHYFGFLDARYDEIAKWLEENNIFFVEDCAHAWLSDLIGGVCGRKGSYSFYSLHKLLPISKGGILVNNIPKENSEGINPYFELNYDLFSIYLIRRLNYKFLVNLLKNVKGITVIYKNLEQGICPQTLPVIVEDYNRNKLYQEMNDLGFGMVSLYHTMIDHLDESPFKSASILAKKIINFPVHQDVNEESIIKMVAKLKKILNVNY